MSTNTTLVNAYEDKTIAGKAIKALRDEGFPEGDIKILQGGTDTLVSELVKRGFDEEKPAALRMLQSRARPCLPPWCPRTRPIRPPRSWTASRPRRTTGRRTTSGPAERVPVVEEGLVVGKAKFATGGVARLPASRSCRSRKP